MTEQMDSDHVIRTAKREIEEEQFRAAVEQEKARQLAERWWHRLLPFTVTIHWRNK